MPVPLAELVAEFADALVMVDASRMSHKEFQPGIGPFGEADAVRAAIVKMKEVNPTRYSGAHTKRLPDLLIPNEWAIELEHSPQLAAGFASAFEKYSKLSSVIPRSLLRGASFVRSETTESRRSTGPRTSFTRTREILAHLATASNYLSLRSQSANAS